MPSVSLYLDRADAPILLDWLNGQADIAFIRRSDDDRPRAVKRITRLDEGRHQLWHRPSGPIPLLVTPGSHEVAVAQWLESAMGAPISARMGLDENHPGVITFEVQFLREGPEGYVLGLSTIAWVGDRYAPMGWAAHPTTMRWWKRLQAFVKRRATRVSRFGPLDEARPGLTAWAFPAAYAQILEGRARAANPL